uniref:Uncharacterized protein n=1 Tax=Mycena chlorophos TaxID=658473 RepID=A0ABQ0M9M1_MYCCL|nr:predicted protein [Mycena chlorophos]
MQPRQHLLQNSHNPQTHFPNVVALQLLLPAAIHLRGRPRAKPINDLDSNKRRHMREHLLLKFGPPMSKDIAQTHLHDHDLQMGHSIRRREVPEDVCLPSGEQVDAREGRESREIHLDEFLVCKFKFG